MQPGEYFHTDSICEFANTHAIDLEEKKLKIFVVFRSPLVSSILLFHQKTNPRNKYFEKELDGLTFQEYMKNHMINNALTRSILCKSKDEKLTVSIP